MGWVPVGIKSAISNATCCVWNIYYVSVFPVLCAAVSLLLQDDEPRAAQGDGTVVISMEPRQQQLQLIDEQVGILIEGV